MKETAFPPRAVIFDLDGVLLDSFAANAAYYDYIALQMGFAPLSPDDKKLVHRETHERALKHLAGEGGYERALALSRRQGALNLQKHHKLFPGARAVLDRLQAKAVLAVGTNRDSSARRILRELGLVSHFAFILTPGEAPEPKPGKGFMDCLLKKLALEAGDVVYVGDSLVDEQLCRAGGVRLLAFQNEELRAWAYVNEFTAIPAALGF
ncbi:MAG: HAD family hydrolase [Desulfarculales bacterium]|jgi:phosphoglycolate phosphatase-like HAD superfamily hydrolase|nr:HAD family hydrolase [Desulfarculales bacterium]